ncbi:MAG: c-type cytochrome [Aggregatilineales bacterium]
MSCPACRWRFATLLVALLAAACTGLAGEPQIVATIPLPSPAPIEAAHPLAPPDLRLGAAIYAARCAECHGIGGAGDGALVQSGQVQNAGNFTEPDAARPQRPVEWHETIANGRLERLMPPWRDALSPEQRWAVALYTYTLHYSAEQIERGRAVYQAACADCHGERGRGDGPRAAELAGSVGDLTDQAVMAVLSDETIYAIIAEGIGDGMPAFADDLTEEEMRAAAAYTRTLSLTNLPAAWLPAARPPDARPLQPAATEEIAPPPATVAPLPATLDIRGTVEQGTAGAEVPADLVLTLFVFAPDLTRQQIETTVGADGTFVFEDVPFDADHTFVVTTAYRERIFAGEPTSGAALLDDPTLPLTIYELTEDPTVIEIARLVTQINVTRTTLEVAQVFNIRNTSDRVYTTSNRTPDGRPISLIIPLPPGAIVPGFAEQGRYLFAADEFTVADTLPVLPGDDTLVQLVYLLEFNGGAIIEQELLYAVDGPVRLLVRPPDTVITSDQLLPLGPETLGASVYMSYGDQLTLPNGGILRFEVSSAGTGALGGAGGVITANNLLPVILVVIGAQVLIVGLLYWVYTRRRAIAGTASVTTDPAASPDRSILIDGLIGQIAELDAEFEAGRLEETDYQRQRGVLKARLAQLMGSEDGG